ncbi:MAG: SPOR domain-containing protein [Hyphomicrobiaceae bacterium]|nr:SPOR domain-containing protein [Hyphomicrobiaceae bacterium]
MENDKPSNPSSDKSGGDLIEEMARLMARDASGSRPDPGMSANDDAQSSWRPQPRTAAPAIALEPRPSSSQMTPPPANLRAESDAPRREPTFAQEESAPSWMPRPLKPAAAETQPVDVPRMEMPEPRREEPMPRIEVPAPQMEAPRMQPRPAGPTTPLSSEAPRETPRPPEASAQQSSRFEFDFGFDRSAAPAPKPQPEPQPQQSSWAPSTPAPARREPQVPAPPPPAPRVAPPSPAPASMQAEEDDPIAELIRAQLATPAASTPRPAPAPEPQAPMAAPAAPQPETPQQDRFSVSPVFGLGGKVAPRQAKSTSGSAALDEIENLIGNAVRLDGHDTSARDAVEGPRPAAPMPNAQQPQRPMAQPAAPQPAARQAPRPAPRPAAIEIEDNVAAAEAAIHAAMQDDTGDASGLLRDNYGDDGEPVLAEGRARVQRGGSLRRWLVPVAALALLGVVVYGVYAFLTGGFGTPSGEAPLISASNDPSKAAPEPGSNQSADQSVVLDGQSGDATDERLVSRDQSQENADPIRQIITAETDENGLANRKVRTVTVRPDGTIIQGDDQVAGTEELGVDRPNVPALPEGAVDSDLANTTVASLTNDAAAASTTETVVAAANLVDVNGSSVPYPAPRIADREARLAAATPATPIATEPVDTGAVDLVGNTPAQPTVTQPVAAATLAAGAWVQLASQRSQGAAEDTAAVLTRQFGSLFNGQQLQIQKADLGDRGTFYRIMLPASSLTDATNICTRIQSAGGNCFPRNN